MHKLVCVAALHTTTTAFAQVLCILLENFVLQAEADLQVLQSAQNGHGDVGPRDLLRIQDRKVRSLP